MVTVELESFGSLEDFFRALIVLRAVQHGESLRANERTIKGLCRMGLIKRGLKGQVLAVNDKLHLRVV